MSLYITVSKHKSKILIIILLFSIYINFHLRACHTDRKIINLTLPFNFRSGQDVNCKEEDEGFERVQLTRAASVSNTCQSHYNKLYVKEFVPKLRLFKHMQYEKGHNLINCPVWKAMTTAIDAMLLELSGNVVNETRLKSIAHYTLSLPEDYNLSKDLLNKSFKLIIVRHPFDRLLSCYLEKILQRKRPMFYIYLRDLIRERYRFNQSDKSPPSFSEFVDYIIDYFKVQYDKPLTWDSKTYDWMPAYFLCGVCNVKYDLILKYENIGHEKIHLYNALNITKDYLGEKLYHVSGSSVNLRKKYFSTLSEVQIEQLISAYKFDFAMFNYCADGYKFY